MNKPISEIEVEIESKKDKVSIAAFLTKFASLVAAMSIILGLLGYGVALSAEDAFSVPHSSLFQSPFELLDLSSIALVQLIDGGFSLLNTSGTVIARLYISSWKVTVLGISGWFVFFCVLVFLYKKYPSFFMQKKTSHTKSQPMSFRKKGFLANVLVIGTLALQPLFAYLFILLLVLATALITIAPLMGMSAGTAYIQKWVINAEQCKPTYPSFSAKKEKSKESITVVSCLAIFDKNDLLGSGRLVFSTSSAVVLFDPNTKLPKRVPIEGMIIQPISKI